MPALTSTSAAEEPAGPEPTTATRNPKEILPSYSLLRSESYHAVLAQSDDLKAKTVNLKHTLTNS
jgi:hypothetical protein